MFKEVPSSEIHRTVKQVLNSPKFVRARREELSNDQSRDILREMIRKALKGIYNILKKLGFNIESLNNISKGYRAAYIIELMCVIILLILFIYFLIKFFTRREKVKLDYGKAAEEININADYANMALESVDIGNYKEGIRYIFWACIIELNKNGLISIEKSKTNYQYYLELKARNFKLMNKFKSCGVIFNEIWYGKRKADEFKYNEILKFYKDLCEIAKHDRSEKHEK
jgi:hypothetical protein